MLCRTTLGFPAHVLCLICCLIRYSLQGGGLTGAHSFGNESFVVGKAWQQGQLWLCLWGHRLHPNSPRSGEIGPEPERTIRPFPHCQSLPPAGPQLSKEPRPLGTQCPNTGAYGKGRTFHTQTITMPTVLALPFKAECLVPGVLMSGMHVKTMESPCVKQLRYCLAQCSNFMSHRLKWLIYTNPHYRACMGNSSVSLSGSFYCLFGSVHSTSQVSLRLTAILQPPPLKGWVYRCESWHTGRLTVLHSRPAAIPRQKLCPYLRTWPTALLSELSLEG